MSSLNKRRELVISVKQVSLLMKHTTLYYLHLLSCYLHMTIIDSPHNDMWMSTAVYDTICIAHVFMTETKVSQNNTSLMPGCDIVYTVLCLLCHYKVKKLTKLTD